jgi:hypothetical protein
MMATVVPGNTKEAMMLLWWTMAESAFNGSLESGSRFCVGAFGINREDVFTINLLYKEIYRCYIFSAICKYNSAINCITV